MNILIVGNGGREHALAWKINQSPQCSKLFVAPGNAGTGQLAENVPIAVDDFERLANFCLSQKIDLIVIGPELPLVKGLRDFFESREGLRQIKIVGPGKSGARLEGSKDFSKQFMLRHHIPTARAKTFHSQEVSGAIDFLRTVSPPYVLKADGLAAGKGVIITADFEEAVQSLREMLEQKKFGEASAKVLVEEYLDGIELSVFVLTDGMDYVLLPEAKDYKRIGEQDTGLNTGGMGAVSPVVFANSMFLSKVEQEIVRPTLAGLQAEGIDYRGFIFIGLMNVNGQPFVIEYNARMGDPETEAVMTRIDSDLVELLDAAATQRLAGRKIALKKNYAVTVVAASGGYPENFEKGKPMAGLQTDEALIFHAGTKAVGDTVVTDGGRVLAITGNGATLQEAQQNAYAAISHIRWEGMYFRRDIGLDLQKLELS